MKKIVKNPILTKIEFDNHSVTNKLVGFVTLDSNHQWRGTREKTDVKKLIVLPDFELSKKLKKHMIYKCKLVPMNNKAGFVAVSASPLKYKARIETEMHPDYFVVKLYYGNRILVYNPKCKSPKYGNLKSVLEHLRSIEVIENLPDVVNDFCNIINQTAAQYV